MTTKRRKHQLNVLNHNKMSGNIFTGNYSAFRFSNR
jgi:hypothetical protein